MHNKYVDYNGFADIPLATESSSESWQSGIVLTTAVLQVALFVRPYVYFMGDDWMY